MSKKGKMWLRRCLLIAGGIAVLFLWENAYMRWSSLAQGYSTVSLRFGENVRYEQVREALASITGCQPIFWSQDNGQSLKSEDSPGEVHEVDVFRFYGSGEEILPARFVEGGYPPPLVDGGCAVSSALSNELWGGEEAVGRKVLCEKGEYQIYGVFEDTRRMLLLQQHPRANVEYSAVELTASAEEGGKMLALDFVKRNGLPDPSNVINGPGLCWMLYQLTLLPLYVLLVMLAARVRRLFWAKWAKAAMLTGCFLLLLWLFLFPYQSLLPSIAANWTDPSFLWGLLQSFQLHIGEYSSLLPTYRDAWLTGQIAAISVSAILASVGVIVLVKLVIYPRCFPIPFAEGEEEAHLQEKEPRFASKA